jgi:hypothetical protein
MRSSGKRGIFLAAVTAGVMILGSSANAAITTPKLTFFKGGGATIGWSTNGGSSPSDPYSNGQSIQIVNPAGGDAGAYTYGASETLVGLRGSTLSGINRLGFDSKGYLGNGAPRISLGLFNTQTHAEATLFLSAYYCNDPLSGGWVTSDFADSPGISPGTSTAGALGGCYVVDGAGNFYGPDGLTSAESAYPAPDWVVVSASNDWFLIQDEPTAGQGGSATVYIDRLTVQDWMWVRSGTAGRINCSNLGCI